MERRQEQCTAPADLVLETVRAWPIWLTEVERRRMPSFPRRAARHRAWASLRGLRSPVERKNGGQLAEVNGDATPDGVPHVLGRALGDAEAVRQDLRAQVVEHLGDPHAVLVMDETGLLKQGPHAAGVARPQSGTAGRVEHGHIGVFVTSASAQGHVLLARARSLPQAWTDDVGRCERAGIPPERSCATKPPLARQLRERALDAAVPAAWVAAESVYGDHRQRRAWLEERPQADVLTVSGNEQVGRAGRPWPVQTLLARLEEDDWGRLQAGDGTKGPRGYDGRGLPLAAPWQPHWRRWLVVRRSLRDPTERTAYVGCAPEPTPLATVVQVVGRRWTIDRCFEEATGEVGREQYAVRHGTGWQRHLPLARWAYALVTVLRATPLPTAPP